MTPLLAYEQVYKYRFRRDAREHVSYDEILRGVSCSIPAGERLVVLGPPGSGKTTLLRLALRLEDPTAGSILVEGTDARSLPVPELRRRMGYVPQLPHLFGETVGENVAYGPLLRGCSAEEARRRARHALDRAGLDGSFLDRKTGSLNPAQARRVSLARALAADPELLVVDEVALGDEGSGSLLDGLDTTGLTLLCATSWPDRARLDGEQLLLLLDGRVVEQGPALEVLRNPPDEARRFILGRR